MGNVCIRDECDECDDPMPLSGAAAAVPPPPAPSTPELVAEDSSSSSSLTGAALPPPAPSPLRASLQASLQASSNAVPSNPLAPSPVASAVDFSELNGSWFQDRTENMDEFLNEMKVPWLIARLVKSVKPSQDLEFSAQGFTITMKGGPKGPTTEACAWDKELAVTTPRGEEGTLLCSYAFQGSSVKVKSKIRTATGLDLVFRQIVGEELVMTCGPKVSARDGKTRVSMKRIFKRQIVERERKLNKTIQS